MAQVVDGFPGGIERSKYEKYLDGQVWQLQLGVDCSKDVANARSTLFVYAKRHGVKVRTRIHDGKLYVQAILGAP